MGALAGQRKRPGEEVRPFPVCGRREEVPAWLASGGRRYRRASVLPKRQATLTSFQLFSKAVLIGLETSSAALVVTACSSLACSTAVSTALRTKAVCNSI